MNRKGSFLFRLISLSILLSVLVLIYVFLIEEVKDLTFAKKNKTEKVIELKNLVEVNLVEKEKLQSEERITKIAQDELGLIFSENNLTGIKMNKIEIDELESLLEKAYD